MRVLAVSLVAVLGCLSPALAAEIEVDSAVIAATLYPQGASVERSADFEAGAGRHTVLIVGMPAQFRRESLRITGEGSSGFRILSTDERKAATRALEAQRRSKSRDIRKAIEALQDKQQFAQNAVQAAQQQQQFIQMMAKAQAQASAKDSALVSADQYTGMWSSIGEGVKSALDTQRRAQMEMREIREQINELNAQLRDVGVERSYGPVLAVEIEADAPVDGALSVKYQIDNAAWAPVYDARLSLGDAPDLTLVRRAQVQQYTGEDWSDVALTLSTARPSGRSAAPDPKLLFAQIYEERPEATFSKGMAADTMVQSRGMAKEAMPMVMAAPAPPPPSVAAMSVGAVADLQGETVRYTIPGAASVSGSGERKQLMIDEIDAEVTLEVRATPSLDQTAYLYAEFRNAGDAPVLPGQVSLYRDEVFVGRAPLSKIAGGETAFIPFGNYDSVKIKHHEIERIEGEQGLIRSRQTERRRYEMSAENFGDKAVKLVILDSMPYAENEDVEIILRADPKPDARDVEGRKGALAWRYDLAPGQKRGIMHGYDVIYPMDAELILTR